MAAVAQQLGMVPRMLPGGAMPVRISRARTCRELLRELLEQPLTPFAAGKLVFAGVGERDVYNITAPFRFDGRTMIAARVEPRQAELATLMFFAREHDGAWHPVPGAPVFEGLQDPCVAVIDDELVLGGVRYPVPMADGRMGWRTDFYRGRSLADLRPFLSGPDRMKDVRMVELPGGGVGVFTRPQGRVGGRGKIGFTQVPRLDALSTEIIAAAPLLADQVPGSEWLGANEAHVLRDGRLGVLGHVAHFGRQRKRHYYPMVFALDPETRATTPLRLIARRGLFPGGPAKRPDLVDVVFSGGLLRNWDGTATLFAGLSDAEAGWLNIPDPMGMLEAEGR